MALQDTIVNLGNAIINLVNSKILKANAEQDEKVEKELNELKTKIDDLVGQGGGETESDQITLVDFVNNIHLDTLNTADKTIVGAINEVESVTQQKIDKKQDKLTEGTGISISSDNVISCTVSSANSEWGNITGDITNQPDLVAKLDEKANATDLESKANSSDLENYLPLSGGTVTGSTTFNDTVVLHDTFIEVDDDTKYSDWGYNWDRGVGPGFSMRSANYSTGQPKYKGAFLLWARKNTTSQYVLAGRCDGVLEWCDKEVLHTGNAYNKTQIDDKIGDIETALDAIIAG